MEEGGADTCNENHTLGGKKCYQNIGIHGDELNENALCRPTGGATEDVMTRHKRRKHVTTACLLLAAFGIVRIRLSIHGWFRKFKTHFMLWSFREKDTLKYIF